jgi:polyisoprenoid-binding protein YceI
MPGTLCKRYVLDAKRSRFTVQVFAHGVLAGFAHSPAYAIRQFEGEMSFDPQNQADCTFGMVVNAASLELLDNVRAQDREQMQKQLMEDVLEVAKYPTIIFHCTDMTANQIAEGWFRTQLEGAIRLHGVTRPLSIDAQLRLAAAELRLAGDFRLLLSDYRIRQVSALGGLITLKEDLKFIFDLLGAANNAEA